MNIKDFIKWLERLPSTTEVTSTIVATDSLSPLIHVTSNFSYFEKEMKEIDSETHYIDDILTGVVEQFDEFI